MGRLRNRTLQLAAAASFAVLTACNGIFADLYDAPSQTAEFGFVAFDAATRRGTIYLDATAYDQWHYIDLHRRTLETVTIGDGAAAPAEWDFALHRYDTKTHGGAAADSGCDSFEAAARALPLLDDGDFAADSWTEERIAVDMSQMMEGTIRYTADYWNPVLSGWLDVDTSTMPPLYTLSHRVYLLRLADGTQAALRLADFMNDAGVKGFMTIEYLWPL